MHHSDGIYPDADEFQLPAALTANTFIHPDTRRSGDQWATFLLGAIDNNSVRRDRAIPESRRQLLRGIHAGRHQADANDHVEPGLRYEYRDRTPGLESRTRSSRAISISRRRSRRCRQRRRRFPQMLRRSASVRPSINGAWVFTDRSSTAACSTWTRPTCSCRAPALAIRINDKTALRAGFARYVSPPLIVGNTLAGTLDALLQCGDDRGAAARRGPAGSSERSFSRRRIADSSCRKARWGATPTWGTPRIGTRRNSNRR